MSLWPSGPQGEIEGADYVEEADLVDNGRLL